MTDNEPFSEEDRERYMATRSTFNPFPAPVSRPAEPTAGTVIGFVKLFAADGTEYHYAAISIARDKWFLSGPRLGGAAMSWDLLLDFIGGPENWAGVGVVASWRPLVEAQS